MAHCKICRKVAAKNYYMKNRERSLFVSKQYQINHRERTRATMRRYEERHREKRALKNKKWRQENPEKFRAGKIKRRLIDLSIKGLFTEHDVKDIFRLQKGKCACCKKSLKDGYHIDHIIPLSRGGTNYRSNLQLLTPSCNHRKSARDPIEYMQSKGFLI